MERLIHLHVLASGSKGNAALVEGPDGMVLIDCGVSRKCLVERANELGVDTGGIAAVLFTHEHSDHVSGASVFCRRFEGPIIATAGTVRARDYLARLPFDFVSSHDVFGLAGMVVHTFPTSHDVADPFGLRFSVVDEDGVERDALGWCTDTGRLTDEAYELLHGVRILGLESNHDGGMLRTGPYPAFLKARVGGDYGHLSNEQSAAAVPELITEDSEALVALHLSEENNRPSLAVRALAAAVGAEASNATFTEARTPDGRLVVRAAAQNRPLSVW